MQQCRNIYLGRPGRHVGAWEGRESEGWIRMGFVVSIRLDVSLHDVVGAHWVGLGSSRGQGIA